jgi:hypothetical protein
MRWCESQQPPLEYGRGERNDVFWQIELNEARGRHRLMKLKDGSSQTAANYFALKEHEPHVLLEGARRGLWLVPWNADARNSQLGGIGNWEWAESTKLVG